MARTRNPRRANRSSASAAPGTAPQSGSTASGAPLTRMLVADHNRHAASPGIEGKLGPIGAAVVTGGLGTDPPREGVQRGLHRIALWRQFPSISCDPAR